MAEERIEGQDHDGIERRLARLEEQTIREARWWRGGLIAALVFVGLVMLFGHRHRHKVFHGGWPGGPGYMYPGQMMGWSGAPPWMMAGPPPWLMWHHHGCHHRWHGHHEPHGPSSEGPSE